MIYSSKRGRLSPEQALIPATSPAFQYGLGLFETLRCGPLGKLFLPQRHLARLFASAQALGIKFFCSPEQAMALLVKAAGKAQAPKRIKIIGIEGELLIFTEPYIENTTPQQGVKLWPLKLTRTLPQHKTLNYLDCLFAWQAAQEKGFFDALLIDHQGFAREASRANLFWVKEGVVYTNREQSLPGILQTFLCEQRQWNIQQAEIKSEALRQAEEVLITSSLRGVLPVTAIGDQAFNSGPKTSELIDFYLSAR